MRLPRTRSLLAVATGAIVAAALLPAASYAADPAPEPGSPAYVARDLQNINDAYGRISGPGGQLQNPAYLPALVAAGLEDQTSQLMEQAASPTRLAITPGNVSHRYTATAEARTPASSRSSVCRDGGSRSVMMSRSVDS